LHKFRDENTKKQTQSLRPYGCKREKKEKRKKTHGRLGLEGKKELSERGRRIYLPRKQKEKTMGGKNLMERKNKARTKHQTFVLLAVTG